MTEKQKELDKIYSMYNKMKVYEDECAEWDRTDEWGNQEWISKGHFEDETPVYIVYTISKEAREYEDGSKMETADLYDWDDAPVKVELQEAPEWTDEWLESNEMIAKECEGKDIEVGE